MIVVSPLRRGGYRTRAGITLTEILISIMIMGIGMVSLATLFPLGMIKLRDAARFSRSAYLAESATADLIGRGLLTSNSFKLADNANLNISAPPPTYWFQTYDSVGNLTFYNPLTVDPPYRVSATYPETLGLMNQGQPFAYDPLWRYQTGIYPDPTNLTTNEARFASGINFLRTIADTNKDPLLNVEQPSAYGLPRLTNFNGLTVTVGTVNVAVMPASQFVPSIFVSPEDIVWQDPNGKNLFFGGQGLTLSNPADSSTSLDLAPSPLVPDLNISYDSLSRLVAGDSYSTNNPSIMLDLHYTWMFTGRQIAASSSGATIDGQIVIFENRPFSLDQVISGIDNTAYPQAAGERVVEAIYGYNSSSVVSVGTDSGGNPVYNGSGASKTVLLRWPNSVPDIEIKSGSWIADVTYERYSTVAALRFPSTALFAPPQRCYWYQIARVNPPADDGATGYRYMVVTTSSPLQSRTLLDSSGVPLQVNAALVSPHVVSVIPRTFTTN